MSYAVQVRWPDGHWTFVVEGSTGVVEAYPTREVAEQAAVAWIKPGQEDAVRVVELPTVRSKWRPR